MRFLLVGLLTFLIVHAIGQSPITHAEYFIDTDPGIGEGIPVTISSGTEVAVDFDVELDGLEPGIHYLHVRVKNSIDKWSLYARKVFYIAQIQPSQTIVAAEYFMDDDPGIGNGSDIPVTAGQQISESFAIPLEDEEVGLHFLHIRVKDSQDKWSFYGRKIFYIIPEQEEFDIVAAEYFIDTDPGVGNAVPLAVTPGLSISEMIDIPTSDALADGTHLLHMRVLDDAGKWSLYAAREFVVDPTVGMEEIQIGFEIFPNPAKDVLFVQTNESVISSVRIIDLKGKLVYEKAYSANQVEIDMGFLAAGSYLVQVWNSADKGFSELVLKQ